MAEEADQSIELEADIDSRLIDLVASIAALQSQEEELIDLLSLSEDEKQRLTRMKVNRYDGKLTVLGYLCVKTPCPQKVLQCLLSPNVNLSEEFDGHSITLLHLAAYCGNSGAVKVLCSEFGVERFHKTKCSPSALHMAVKSGVIEEMLDWVSAQSPDLVNGLDDLGMAPLHHAAWEGDISMTASLLGNRNIDVNIGVEEGVVQGYRALHLASLKNQVEVMDQLLCFSNIDVNTADSDGYTVLHLASLNNQAEVVRKLLDFRDIDVNAAEIEGFTPLHTAAWNNNAEILDLLLRSPLIGTSLRGQTGEFGDRSRIYRGPVNLPYSIESSESHLLQFSAKRKSHYERMQGAQPFLFSSYLKGDWKELRHEEFKIFKHGHGAFTPLLCAARLGHLRIVRTLLEKISEEPRARTLANAVGDGGLSALHYAVMKGDASMVEELLSYNNVRGNVRESSVSKLTPLNMAYHIVQRLEGEDWQLPEYKTIIGLLLEHPDVQFHVESLYKDRQLFVDAANAILVGAALIASITFAGWLQPPLGYQQYYESRYLLTRAAPPDTYAAFATVKQHVSVATFWVFNSLSFFFAVGTVLIGSCVVLPMLDKSELEAHVNRMRILHMWTTLFLSFSVAFVLGAFIAAGFAALPSELEYQWVMIITTGIGGFVALCTLFYYLLRVIKLIKLLTRQCQAEASRSPILGYDVGFRSRI